MTELRAIAADSAITSTARAACESLACFGSLLLFALLCLGWSLVALPLSALMPPQIGRRFGRLGIHGGFRLYARWLALIGAYRFDLAELEQLQDCGPLLLAPNHPSLIDAVLIAACVPNLSCVMKSELMGNILLGPGARLARYIRNGSPHQMVREAVAELGRGGVVLLFPEGTRTIRRPVNPLCKSVGVVARHARVPVQTLLIETDSGFLGKNCPLWARPSLPIGYRVRLGRRFDPPQDPAAFRQELERYFRSELQSGSPGSHDARGSHRRGSHDSLSSCR